MAFIVVTASTEVGAVSVYEQSRFGDWEKVEDPFVYPCGNVDGYSVGIDGDLACVAGFYFDALLFRRVNTKWVQFKNIDVYSATCSIAGDIIAIEGKNSDFEDILLFYKYDSDLGGVVLLQDPISANVAQMTLSNGHLVFSTIRDDIFIYRREDADQTFTLHQQIGTSYSGWLVPFAFDEDILAIGGDDHTRIFSEHDGRWEETLVLDRSYDDYQLSGRMLIAANETGVYSFNIEDCVQPVPTLMPSAAPSPTPSVSPSLLPSQSPSSSFPPSTTLTPSLSPTETCFWVEIDVLTDWKYFETWWDVSSVTAVDGSQEKNVVYDSSTIEVQMEGKTFHTAHVLLSATDTSANGALCDCGDGSDRCDCQGRVCLIERSIGLPSYVDNDLSICEDGGGVAAIIYDNVERPLWSPWADGSNIPAAFISQADGRYLLEHGLGKAILVTASSSLQFEREALHSRCVCLPEGDYEFTIYDHFDEFSGTGRPGGDGICCDYEGYYKVTSNGATIKEGGEFGSEESTPFSLPFVPAPAPA